MLPAPFSAKPLKPARPYSSPDQLNNSIEARIDSVRNGDWSSLLKTIDNDGELVAKSKWGNGGGGFVNW